MQPLTAKKIMPADRSAPVFPTKRVMGGAGGVAKSEDPGSLNKNLAISIGWLYHGYKNLTLSEGCTYNEPDAAFPCSV
jgi:hypothetical protein